MPQAAELLASEIRESSSSADPGFCAGWRARRASGLPARLKMDIAAIYQRALNDVALIDAPLRGCGD